MAFAARMARIEILPIIWNEQQTYPLPPAIAREDGRNVMRLGAESTWPKPSTQP
jgi:hypothetical protein